MVWIDRFLLLALVAVVGVLAITAIPSLAGGHLGGRMLMAHMAASGILVIGMPIFGVAFLRYFLGAGFVARSQQLGYVATIATGVLTIATVFLCMLPIPSTEEMHALMTWHGWAGFAMIPAIALLLLGYRSTRSALHPHS